MQNVATLITDPRRADLVDTAPRAVGRVLAAAGAAIIDTNWLADHIACDVVFDGLSCDGARESLADEINDGDFDLVVQPRLGRRKDLLIADMDATIVKGETLDELAAIAGVSERVAAITARAMNGEMEFQAALRERVGLLKNVPADALVETAERIRLTAGARTLVRTMRAHGAYTILVSGGLKFFSSRIAMAVGFDADESNRLEITGDRLTGRVLEPILDKHGKLEVLRRTARERNVPLTETLAVGDGANDLPMIEGAGLGVAFRAKPVVVAGAHAAIRHGDLTALLYLQGYAGTEFRK